MKVIFSFYDYVPEILMFIPHRPDEYQVGMLQRLESAGEHVLLQSQIKTSYWTDALQHPTMSFQVRPNVFFSFYATVVCAIIAVMIGTWSFHFIIESRDNLWFQNFMNDPINISTLYVLLALNPDIIKKRLKCVQTFPHIFLIHTFGWKKTEYLLLLDFSTSGYVSYSVVQSTFPGRAIKRPVGYVTARNIVGCHCSAFCTCMFMSGTWGDRWSGSGAVSQIGWCSCTSSTC